MSTLRRLESRSKHHDALRFSNSIECPHRGVEVEYQPEKGEFECASLGSSQFATDGSRLGGPAKKPLRVFRTSFDPDTGDRLIIDLSV